MSDMTEADAQRLVEERAGELPGDRVWVVQKVPTGWGFHEQSRDYIETGEFSAQLVGQTLWLVTADGEVLSFASNPDGYARFEAAAGLA